MSFSDFGGFRRSVRLAEKGFWTLAEIFGANVQNVQKLPFLLKDTVTTPVCFLFVCLFVCFGTTARCHLVQEEWTEFTLACHPCSVTATLVTWLCSPVATGSRLLRFTSGWECLSLSPSLCIPQTHTAACHQSGGCTLPPTHTPVPTLSHTHTHPSLSVEWEEEHGQEDVASAAETAQRCTGWPPSGRLWNAVTS